MVSLSGPVGVQHESGGSGLLLKERQAVVQETRSHRPVLISQPCWSYLTYVRFILAHECLWEEIYLLQFPSSWDQKLLCWIRFHVQCCILGVFVCFWASISCDAVCNWDRYHDWKWSWHLLLLALQKFIFYFPHVFKEPWVCANILFTLVRSVCVCRSVWTAVSLLRPAAVHTALFMLGSFIFIEAGRKISGAFQGLYAYYKFRAVIFNVLWVISVSGLWDVWLSLWLYLY